MNKEEVWEVLRSTTYVTPNRTKLWHKGTELHREDGPAVEFSDGTRFWYQNDQRHRLDGPAMEYNDGTKLWYIHGVLYTKKEFTIATQLLNNEE